MMAARAPFAITFRLTADMARAVVEKEPRMLQALAHFAASQVTATLLVHNPYDDQKVGQALEKFQTGDIPWPPPDIQDTALTMVDLEKPAHWPDPQAADGTSQFYLHGPWCKDRRPATTPATPEQIARINDRSTWKTCSCNPLTAHACREA